MMEQTNTGLVKGILKSTKFKFICAGIVNTAVDFIVFNIVLFTTGLRPEIASVISTSAAMCVSYLLNRRLVFKVSGKLLSRELPLFLLATIVSQWVVQAIVINYVAGLLGGLTNSITFTNAGTHLLLDWLIVNLAKAIAVLAGAAANYLLYSRIVFVDKSLSWGWQWRKK